ncbi:hypothetical protein ACFQ0Q_42795 [Streptomyces aureus]
MTQQHTADPGPVEAGPTVAATGDEVFQVETHGIDPIPDSERHGGAKDLFWLWFGSNLTFTYVINGALAVSFGSRSGRRPRPSSSVAWRSSRSAPPD